MLEFQAEFKFVFFSLVRAKKQLLERGLVLWGPVLLSFK